MRGAGEAKFAALGKSIKLAKDMRGAIECLGVVYGHFLHREQLPDGCLEDAGGGEIPG